MGDTEDLLLARDFLAEAAPAVFLLEVARFLLVEAEAVVRFLIGVGVFLATELLPLAFGLGVALIGLELLLTGVGVCLAILFLLFLLFNR